MGIDHSDFSAFRRSHFQLADPLIRMPLEGKLSKPDRSWGSGAVWLTRKVGDAGDPSLRLKNGYAQDDNAVQKGKLHYHFYAHFVGAMPKIV
jgi:hypothetical protein